MSSHIMPKLWIPCRSVCKLNHGRNIKDRGRRSRQDTWRMTSMPCRCSCLMTCFSSWEAERGSELTPKAGLGAKKDIGAWPMGPSPSAVITIGVSSTAVAPTPLHHSNSAVIIVGVSNIAVVYLCITAVTVMPACNSTHPMAVVF